jgi:HicB family
MRRSNFALRLQPSLMEEARKAAESEGVALNQLINVALAEKVSALRTEEYFQERIRRANRSETLRILDRAGKGNPPREGDELPRNWEGAGGTGKRAKKATPQAGNLKKREAKTRGR